MTDWVPAPPVPVPAGRLVAGTALLGGVVAELELELLLHPAAASTVAATVARPAQPSLRCLRAGVLAEIRSMAFSDPMAPRNLDEPP